MSKRKKQTSFYADLEVSKNLDNLEPGSKTKIINKALTDYFNSGSTELSKLNDLEERVTKLENKAKLYLSQFLI